jgi:hypothetical protein
VSTPSRRSRPPPSPNSTNLSNPSVCQKSPASAVLTHPTTHENRRLQKQALTDERELAIESYRAERKKLKSIQQQTLQLYHRLKAADMVPKELDGRKGTPSKADAGISSTADTSEMDAEARSKILAVMSRCGVTKGSLGMRLLFVMWHKWAEKSALVGRRVAKLQGRWLAGRMSVWLRAWHRAAVMGDDELRAVAASVRRFERRTERRVFITWRGLAAGLAAHELALLASESSVYAPGSPAAGLAAIASLARATPGNTERRVAIATAIASAQEKEGGSPIRGVSFNVDEILGTEGELPPRFPSAVEAKRMAADVTEMVEAMDTQTSSPLERKLSGGLSSRFLTLQSRQGSAPNSPPEPRGSSVGGGEPIAIALEDGDVSSSPGGPARVDQVSLDLDPSAGESSAAGALPDLPETPRSSSRISVDSVGSRPSSSRKSTGAPRDEMISLALERSAMAEAAVVALWAQRARTVARRVFTAWLAAAVRSRADKAEEEIKRLKFQMAEAQAAAEVAAEAAVATAAAKKPKGGFLTRLTSTKSVKKEKASPSDGLSLGNPFEESREEPPSPQSPRLAESPSSKTSMDDNPFKAASPSASIEDNPFKDGVASIEDNPFKAAAADTASSADRGSTAPAKRQSDPAPSKPLAEPKSAPKCCVIM